jgi:GNAT superfamily N-acetyltransferase
MMFDLRSAAESVLSEYDAFTFLISGEKDKVKVEVYDEDVFVARFAFSFIPANPHYVIGWGVKVAEDWQGIGVGQELLNLRQEIAERAGAHTWLSTVNTENDVQNHIMQKHGFSRVVHGGERDTAMWAKDLDPELEPEPTTA